MSATDFSVLEIKMEWGMLNFNLATNFKMYRIQRRSGKFNSCWESIWNNIPCRNITACILTHHCFILKPTIDSDAQEINSFAEGVIEDLEPQQDGLQAFLGGITFFLCNIYCVSFCMIPYFRIIWFSLSMWYLSSLLNWPLSTFIYSQGEYCLV